MFNPSGVRCTDSTHSLREIGKGLYTFSCQSNGSFKFFAVAQGSHSVRKPKLKGMSASVELKDILDGGVLRLGGLREKLGR
jgi:hypothetical protein